MDPSRAPHPEEFAVTFRPEPHTVASAHHSRSTPRKKLDDGSDVRTTATAALRMAASAFGSSL